MLAFGFDADDARLAAPYIADALATAGLLRTTPEPPGDVVETVWSLLAGPDALAALGSVGGTRELAKRIASAMPQQGVTAEQVRCLLIDAYSHGRDDEHANAEFKTEGELYDAIRSGDAKSAQYLEAAGIHVQDGEQ